MAPRRRFVGTTTQTEAAPGERSYPRGHRKVTGRQVYISLAMIGSVVWAIWGKNSDDAWRRCVQSNLNWLFQK
jgi:hypothetical protein